MQKLPTRRSVFGFVTSIILALIAGCASDRGGPTATPAQAAPPPVQLRVLTYNILHGAGLDGKLDLARTAEVIKRVNPDLVALQEVDKGTQRSGRVDEAAELGRLTGMHAVFGKAMDFNGGQYGEAILSRYPFESTNLHALPQIKGREPRGALDVQIKVEGQPLRFISTHWDHLDDDSNRIPQVTAELIAPIETNDPDDISNIARAFCLIPGSGEFVYGTEVYTLQNSTKSVLDNFFPGGTFENAVGDSVSLPSRSGDSLPAKFMNMHNQSGEPCAIDKLA